MPNSDKTEQRQKKLIIIFNIHIRERNTTMKSLEELKAIKAKMQDKVSVRTSSGDVRIVVGMATCGIAAGARPVMTAMIDEVGKRNMLNVVVAQTGCIGMCRYEPIVEVTLPGQDKVTYINVKPDMVPRIVAEHVVNGNPVVEYTIGAAEN